VHTLLTQSFPDVQARPVAHLGQLAPPQSMSVSAPFSTLSVQVGDWQSPPVQTPLVQSPPALHVSPGTHGPQEPPQSTSVSLPFLTPSVQVGARHKKSVPHTLLKQSLPVAHMSPVPHLGQVAPPQSTSVSVPFLAPSLQLASVQMLD
jgi:hypothetical protein